TRTSPSTSTRRRSSTCSRCGSRRSADPYQRGAVQRRRIRPLRRERGTMARKKRGTKLRPKTPSRVKRRKRARRGAAGHQHPELIGLGLAAVGLFLAAVLYAGWNGGYVGAAIADALRAVVGGTTYALPVALCTVGGLMLARSALVDVRPFRTGAAI